MPHRVAGCQALQTLTVAPSSTVAPMPTSEPSSTLQAWMVAPCPAPHKMPVVSCFRVLRCWAPSSDQCTDRHAVAVCWTACVQPEQDGSRAVHPTKLCALEAMVPTASPMVTLLPIVVGRLLFLGLCLATWMITLSWMLVFSPTFMLCTSPAGCKGMVSGRAQRREKLVQRFTWRLPD